MKKDLGFISISCAKLVEHVEQHIEQQSNDNLTTEKPEKPEKI